MANDNQYPGKNTRKLTKSSTSNYATIGKLPPQAIELEEAVLGACMLDKNASLAIIEKLKPEIFYDTRHQLIAESVISLVNQSKPVDILTVSNQLRSMSALEMAGGPFYISELTNKVATAANIEYHTHILYQKYIQRELIRVATEISNKAFEDAADAFDILDDAERSLFNISDSTLRKETEIIANVVKETLDHLNELKEKKEGEFTGVPSGFTELDKITSGFQNSDLIIVAARPGMGKTAFTLSLARNSAVQFNKPIAFFSLEMSSVQLVQRLISSETEIVSQKLREGKLTDDDWLKINHKINALSEAKLFIDDTPQLNILELKAKCRRLKQQHDIKMVIIDYLQLMTVKSDAKVGTREQEIGLISRSLKSLAKELNIPVIALSQLNRNVDKNNDKIPQLSDLRDSGSIEQDADQVFFIYRPAYYKITEDEHGNDTSDLAQIIIAKNRHGNTSTVDLRYVGEYVRFENRSHFEGGFNSGFSQLKQNSNFDSQMDTPGFITKSSKMNNDDFFTDQGPSIDEPAF